MRDPADQVDGGDLDAGASSLAGAGLPAPVEAPSLPVPGDHGGRFDEAQGPAPVAPAAGQHDPERLVGGAELGAGAGALQHDDLLAQGEVLEGQLLAGAYTRDAREKK